MDVAQHKRFHQRHKEVQLEADLVSGMAKDLQQTDGTVVLVVQEVHPEALTVVFHKGHMMREELHHHEGTGGSLGDQQMAMPAVIQQHPEVTIYHIFHNHPMEYGMPFHPVRTWPSLPWHHREIVIEIGSLVIVTAATGGTMIVEMPLRIWIPMFLPIEMKAGGVRARNGALQIARSDILGDRLERRGGLEDEKSLEIGIGPDRNGEVITGGRGAEVLSGRGKEIERGPGKGIGMCTEDEVVCGERRFEYAYFARRLNDECAARGTFGRIRETLWP
jgi:hypothetical protein